MLEEDLGVSLFERSSGRQPMLTEAGATRSWLHDDGCAPMVTPRAARTPMS